MRNKQLLPWVTLFNGGEMPRLLYDILMTIQNPLIWPTASKHLFAENREVL